MPKLFKNIVFKQHDEHKKKTFDFFIDYFYLFSKNISSPLKLSKCSIKGNILKKIDDTYYKILITNMFIDVSNELEHDINIFFEWFQLNMLHLKYSIEIIIEVGKGGKLDNFVRDKPYIFEVISTIGEYPECCVIANQL